MGQALAATAAIDGKAAMLVDGVPPSGVAGNLQGGAIPASVLLASDVKGVVEATSNQWEFRHGTGSESLAIAAAMDGKAAMIVPTVPTLPALGDGNMEAGPATMPVAAPTGTGDAAADVQGMVTQPVGFSANQYVRNPSWDFRHGTGGETLAMAAAINGKAAMILPPMLSQPVLAGGNTVAQPPALSASVAIGGTAVPASSANANTAWDFRHGTGGEALGFSNDFRHGTPSARARRDM